MQFSQRRVILEFYPIALMSLRSILSNRGDAEKLQRMFLLEPSVFKVGEAMLLLGVIHTRGALPLARGVRRCPAWGATSPAMGRAGE